jgi:hypothetical protein
VFIRAHLFDVGHTQTCVGGGGGARHVGGGGGATCRHREGAGDATHISIESSESEEGGGAVRRFWSFPHPASCICKFIHHTMFMITIHCSSTIHQKSVLEDIIHQVHGPHGSHIFASINLLSWRCSLTTSGFKNSFIIMYLMWKNKLFLC